jgi:GntR family histidine utilization transcriptional repressor
MTIPQSQNNVPWPLYQQVKSMIIRRIDSGHWMPGARIPSENELVTQLGISRMTVNRALRELTVEGHLLRKRGAGTYVKDKKPQAALLEIRSIADEIKSWGGQHDCQVILLQKEVGSELLCYEMGRPPGSEVYHSILVHRDRGLPIQLAERFVNPEIAPDYINQDFSRITPSNYLLSIAQVSAIKHIIESRLPDQQTTELLQISETEPCLVLHRTTWLNDTVVTKNRFIYPGSRYSIGGRFSTADFSRQLPS